MCRKNSLSQGIVFTPNTDELAQMVRAQDGTVSGEVIEAVHDDGHHDVEHDEAAEEDERHKVDVGHRRPTRFVFVDHLARRSVVFVCPRVAGSLCHAGHHDFRPGLARGAPEQHQEGGEDGSEVVVSLDGGVGVQGDVAEHLHAHDGVDEEQHHHEHHYIWQSL